MRLIVPLIDLSDILDLNIERFLVTVARAATVNRSAEHADPTIPTCTIIIVCFIGKPSGWQPTAHYAADTLYSDRMICRRNNYFRDFIMN